MNSLAELIDYSNDITKQKEALQASVLFNTEEKQEVIEIYEKPQRFTNTKINTFHDINDALNA